VTDSTANATDRWCGIETPDDLPETFRDDSGDRADEHRDSLADLEVEHTYPVTLSEGALFKRQAQ
jgi:hypothetical protein